LPALLRERAAATPDGVATLHRHGNTVVSTTWSEWERRSRVLAAGLVASGVAPGDRVVLALSTRVEHLWLDMAVLMAGAVPVPVFPLETAETYRLIIGGAGARVVLADGPVELAKLVGAPASELGLTHLFAVDVEGESCRGERLLLADLARDAGAERGPLREVSSVARLRDRGEDALPDVAPEVARRTYALGSEDLALLAFTPGTSGRPKGVRLTHGNHLGAARGLADVLGVGPSDLQLLYLPLAHAFGRIAAVAGLLAGFPTAFARAYRTVLDDARVYKPTFFCSVPRLFEKLQADLGAEQEAASIVHRLLADWSLDVAEGELLEGVKRLIANKLVKDPMREIFGGRVRFAISGAAPLAASTGRFFDERGLPILQGYGLVETCAVSHINPPGDNRYGTVGRPLPGVEVAFMDDGELYLRGPQVTPGYWGEQPEGQSVGEDGWLHTGDLGRVDADGYLTITGRKRDIILTATGKIIAPGPIEAALRLDPLIDQALVHGDRRSFVTALVTLDPEALARHASDAGIEDTYEALVRHPAVYAAVERVVDGVNATLAPHARIRKFAILPTGLDPESGTVTPTLGLRRRLVERAHQALLDSFYAENF